VIFELLRGAECVDAHGAEKVAYAFAYRVGRG
jgi:hypothetical protein